MRVVFRAEQEDFPGALWRAHLDRAGPHCRGWFLSQGDAQRPSYLTCQRKFAEYMPELVSMWEHLVELGGGDDQLARMLSLYCPTPYMRGCSQAIWLGSTPLLVRNYDYHPGRCEGLLLQSAWHGTRVMANSDSLWGVLDGINEHGLALSLAFGGRRETQEGFGIPLVLRYILEFQRHVRGAIAVLKRIPSHMAYSIALVDRRGEHATVYVGPNRDVTVMRRQVSTNHQGDIAWPEHARATRTLEREAYLTEALRHASPHAEDFIGQFLHPPLHSRDHARGFGTLYTAAFWPESGTMDMLWPNRRWRQSFHAFSPEIFLADLE